MKTLLPFLLICSQSAVCGILVPESTDEQQPLFTPPQESVVSVSLPLWANNPNITDFGFFPGGTILLIVVSGTVNLGVPAINTLPDGSLTQPVPFADCGACWVPGYKYFIQNATYPQVAGGDGTNHFPGGGGNYDSVAGDHSPWAAQGPITTDTTNPQAVRFGEVAGTFSANPVPNSSDWFAVGFGGAFQVPPGGAELGLVIADTYYSNNVGSYAVTVSEIPEACSAAMVLIGLLSLAIVAAVRAARPVTYFPALRARCSTPQTSGVGPASRSVYILRTGAPWAGMALVSVAGTHRGILARAAAVAVLQPVQGIRRRGASDIHRKLDLPTRAAQPAVRNISVAPEPCKTGQYQAVGHQRPYYPSASCCPVLQGRASRMYTRSGRIRQSSGCQ